MRRGFKIDVVEAAQNLARCFPELRPRGEEVIAFAEETAAMLGEDDFHVPSDLLAEGLERVELAERRRLVEHFAADQPLGWRRLVADLRANPVAAERALVRGAIKWLICERRDRPRSVLAALEGGDRCRGHRARSSLSSSNRRISGRSSRRQLCRPRSRPS